MKKKNVKHAELKEKELNQVTGGAGYERSGVAVGKAVPGELPLLRKNGVMNDDDELKFR